MGFRFQRRIKILPGIYLNASKSGMSMSAKAGPLTLNSRGTATVGARGTGMSIRHNFAAEERKAQREAESEQKRAERELEMSFPTIKQQIKQFKKVMVGHDCIGHTLWHQTLLIEQGSVGLIGYLLVHEATPREIREHCAAVESWDRVEVQLLRCESRQQANEVCGKLLTSVQALIDFAKEVGICQDDA